ncbi:MAG: MerR family DNA-binding protein [Actinomycetota bacterium]
MGFSSARRSSDLSLGEIREIQAFRDRGEVPCAHAGSLIERHAHDLSERIAALDRMRRDLERLARRPERRRRGRFGAHPSATSSKRGARESAQGFGTAAGESRGA